ncbi:MAG: 4-hydroxy-tetrahydrodipicolinate reductase [bacterium]
MSTRVVVVGALGRMGEALRRAFADEADLEIAAGVERPGHPGLGSPCGSGQVVAHLGEILAQVDVVVDFALSDGVAERARASADAGRCYVCGVTGLDDAAWQELRTAAMRVPVVYAPNFSIGINVLCRLVGVARQLLSAEYDVEVVEVHHRAKSDAPSGTAARLVEAVIEAAEVNRVRNGRCGLVGAKEAGEVGIHSVRTGDVVGDHTVVFGGPGERIELTHRATSREAFARGVAASVRFCVGHEPGLYGMPDVLGASHESPRA